MSVFSRLTKWKLRWAVITGVLTFIVVPIVRLVFKPKVASSKKTSADVIDVNAEEIK